MDRQEYMAWLSEIDELSADQRAEAGRALAEQPAWFKNGLFWVTQTIRILPPGEGGFGAAMKKPGRGSNRSRVQLKGVETA
jgi:hypothetical protein